MEFFEAFGYEFGAMLLLLALLYFSLAFLPFVVPLLRAFWKNHRLPRPLLFTFIVASISYGIPLAALFIFSVPSTLYSVYIAPQLQAAGSYWSPEVVRFGQLSASWWWLIFPTIVSIISVVLTKRLGRKWLSIVSSLAG